MPAKKASKSKAPEPEPEAERAAEEAAAAAASRAASCATALARPQPDVSSLELTEPEVARAAALFRGLPDADGGVVPRAAVAAAVRSFGTDLTPELEAELIHATEWMRANAGDAHAVLTVDECLAVLASAYASPRYHGGALRLATGRGQLRDVEALLRRGCDPCAADGAGATAAHVAADRGQRAALGHIRDVWGAERFDFDAPDTDGWTPLHAAAAAGFRGVVEDLLAWGADPAARNGTGRTPLHAAAAGDHAAIVPVLVAGGADVEAADKAGWTPMHVAALHGSSRCIDALAAAGASATAADLGARPPAKLCHPDASLSLRKAGRSSSAATADA